jgi:hypothetical protein
MAQFQSLTQRKGLDFRKTPRPGAVARIRTLAGLTRAAPPPGAITAINTSAGAGVTIVGGGGGGLSGLTPPEVMFANTPNSITGSANMFWEASTSSLNTTGLGVDSLDGSSAVRISYSGAVTAPGQPVPRIDAGMFLTSGETGQADISGGASYSVPNASWMMKDSSNGAPTLIDMNMACITFYSDAGLSHSAAPFVPYPYVPTPRMWMDWNGSLAVTGMIRMGSYANDPPPYIGVNNPTINPNSVTSAPGAMYWNTTSGAPRIFDGTAWVPFGGGGALSGLTVYDIMIATSTNTINGAGAFPGGTQYMLYWEPASHSVHTPALGVDSLDGSSAVRISYSGNPGSPIAADNGMFLTSGSASQANIAGGMSYTTGVGWVIKVPGGYTTDIDMSAGTSQIAFDAGGNPVPSTGGIIQFFADTGAFNGYIPAWRAQIDYTGRLWAQTGVYAPDISIDRNGHSLWAVDITNNYHPILTLGIDNNLYLDNNFTPGTDVYIRPATGRYIIAGPQAGFLGANNFGFYGEDTFGQPHQMLTTGPDNNTYLEAPSGSQDIYLRTNANRYVFVGTNTNAAAYLAPDADLLHSLGTGSLRWQALYVNNINLVGTLVTPAVTATGQTTTALDSITAVMPQTPGALSQLRLIGTNPATNISTGVMLRNDGGNFYFLVTAPNNPYGGWTAARPFWTPVDGSSVNIGGAGDPNPVPLTVSGNVTGQNFIGNAIGGGVYLPTQSAGAQPVLIMGATDDNLYLENFTPSHDIYIRPSGGRFIFMGSGGAEFVCPNQAPDPNANGSAPTACTLGHPNYWWTKLYVRDVQVAQGANVAGLVQYIAAYNGGVFQGSADGPVTLQAGSNMTLSVSGRTIVFNATGGTSGVSNPFITATIPDQYLASYSNVNFNTVTTAGPISIGTSYAGSGGVNVIQNAQASFAVQGNGNVGAQTINCNQITLHGIYVNSTNLPVITMTVQTNDHVYGGDFGINGVAAGATIAGGAYFLLNGQNVRVIGGIICN